jgi:hypothetical protein
MDDVKRRINWERDSDGAGGIGVTGVACDSGGEVGVGDVPEAINVGDVLCRLDLLGTYDLKGNTIFSHAKNQARSSAQVKPSKVPFGWLSRSDPKESSLNLYRGEETRVTNEWTLEEKSISKERSISNTHRPPPSASRPPPPTTQGASATTCASSASAVEDENSGISIVKWIQEAAGSPDWLQSTSLVGSAGRASGRLPFFGGAAGSPARDGTPLLAKLKEKGPPKTLCKNLPKREAGEQTPFGRERPKLLHTPDAIAMRKAIEAEIILEPVNTYRSNGDSIRSPSTALSHRNSGSWSVRGSNSARSSSEGRMSSPGGAGTARQSKRLSGSDTSPAAR